MYGKITILKIKVTVEAASHLNFAGQRLQFSKQKRTLEKHLDYSVKYTFLAYQLYCIIYEHIIHLELLNSVCHVVKEMKLKKNPLHLSSILLLRIKRLQDAKSFFLITSPKTSKIKGSVNSVALPLTVT